MEIVLRELEEMRERYASAELRSLFDGIDFVLYGVEQGNRIAAVRELLFQRPYTSVRNLDAGDEAISILEMGEKEPALLVIEPTRPDAGLAAMVREFGPRIFSIGFAVRSIERVRELLSLRGAQWMSDGIAERRGVRSIGTAQSAVTRDSCIYIERPAGKREYDFIPNAEPVPTEPEILALLKKRAGMKLFASMRGLDHIAYRVHFADIHRVAEEIMRLTPYAYQEAHEIEEHDAKTVVFRFGGRLPALVASYGRSAASLVEQYVDTHGPRVHHMAYAVAGIRGVVATQRRRSQKFTSEDLIGTEEEGIVQIFTQPSPVTREITEYIERFHGFTGFFSKRNVGALMSSTRAFQ